MTVSARPNYAKAAIHGTAWRYLAFFTGKMMVLVSTVVLARLLSKDDFGVVGYAVTTIGFLDVVSDLGIAPAVIYYRDEKRAANTAFWLGLLIALTLFGLAWFGAPWMGLYFRDNRAVTVIQVLALTYPIAALGSIHETLLRKNLAFGRAFIPDFLQAFTKGGISILFAVLGYGPWSLIIGQLSGAVIAVIMYWVVTGWRPAFEFFADVARSLLKYGMSIVGVDVLGIVLLNLDYLLVGRYLGAEALGAYTLAFRIPDLLILQFTRILSTVIFPIYTKMRDVPGSLSKGFLLTCRYVSLVTVPFSLGLFVMARPFVLVFLTDKWQDVIPVIQAIALYSMVLSLVYNVGSVYKAEGRPQVLTWLGIARLVLLVPALFWAVTGPKTLAAVGWAQVSVALLGGTLNLFVATRLLKIRFLTLIDSMRPALTAGLLLLLAASAVLWLGQTWPAWLQLLSGVTAGALAYMGVLWFLFRSLTVNVVQSLRSAIKR